MSQRKGIRVALIGYGFAGRTFHAPLIAAVPALSLTVVASSDATRVHADLPRVEVMADPMLAVQSDEVDLVVIATPNESHFALAQAALQAGKHVVVDKPMTPSLREARELVALATQCERMLAVFHNRRWDSDFLSIRDAIAAGRVGHVVHVEARWERFRPDVRERWRERPGPASGVWWDLGPHLVDQALQLLGRPDAVQADMAMQRDGTATDDWAHVVLSFGRVRAVLHAAMVAAAPGARFTVHGTRGSLVKAGADRQETQLIDGLRPGDEAWGIDPDELHWHRDDGSIETLPAARGDQSRFYAGVADALLRGAQPPVLPTQALEVMAVMEAARRSAEQGRVVPLDEVVDERLSNAAR
ncbi:oxidoreductase [Cognatilysobacter bugurensis]|uniref:Oxidoreductase n=1 Tax=Cognatilysobacter bugurensis TaxID=543356 RepID=A0A918W6S9_9GAMM|nr:oxidoreductase [Lysobacter bugurensis]GHA79191.1 oxidoreductase [Lysobacter bugurensis]